MKRYLNKRIIQCGGCLLLCLLGSVAAVNAQQFQSISIATAGGGSGQAGGFFVNGTDIGTTLLKTCDLNQDGKVTLSELKQVADACFKLWDTNSDGYLSPDELSTALTALFPAPPPGARHAVRVINGVAMEVSPEDLPTPDKQITKHLFAQADANKDGWLSLQELNDFLDKSFSQWDQDGNGSLDAQELAAAFGQLAMPDLPN
jgi:Ca2+-binding EF-hand superfamily protein